MDADSTAGPGSMIVDQKGQPVAMGVSPEFLQSVIAQRRDVCETPRPASVPMFDRIILEQDPPPSTYAPEGRIVVPDQYLEYACTGVIVDMGLGCRKMLEDAGNRIGDRVLWAKFAGLNGPKGDGAKIPWKTKNVVVLMAKDIVLNFSLYERLERGEWSIERSKQTGEYGFNTGNTEAK